MPSRMEEIAARSAQSPSEYEARREANDALAAAWRSSKKKDVERQQVAVKKSYPDSGPTGEGRPSAGRIPGRPTFAPAVETVVMVPTVMPPVVSEPPVDMVDYSLVPVVMDVPWEQSPVSIVAIPAVIGTMMVMLGKRMLVSIAVAGMNFAIMEPLQQYGKGLPKARVLWHTGRANAGMKSNKAAYPEAYMNPGAGFSGPRSRLQDRRDNTPLALEDKAGLAKALETGSNASEWLSEQIRTFYGFPGWLD